MMLLFNRKPVIFARSKEGTGAYDSYILLNTGNNIWRDSSDG